MTQFVYILKSESTDKFYVGMSCNPNLRLTHHNSTEKGFTSRYRPWKLVWSKAFPARKDAHKIEYSIKKWKSSKQIQKLIDGEILHPHSLKQNPSNEFATDD